METKLINKDKLWNRVKNYIYLIVILVSLLIVLIISSIILNWCIYKKLNVVA